MCPDPYDYSGPVPNRSAPQNDFRARSNGIAPIGVSPRPWPPLVRKDGKPEAAGEPALMASAGPAQSAAAKPAQSAPQLPRPPQRQDEVIDVVGEEPVAGDDATERQAVAGDEADGLLLR